MDDDGEDPAQQDEGAHEPGREVTSDYEPSLEGSVFGSLTSSVKDHVWEYGR